MSGYIKLYRGWSQNAVFGSANFKYTRREAWVWLLENACWKDTKFDIQGRTISIQRGQICVSIRGLASAWKWSPTAVPRYLRRLQTDTMIETQTDTGKTIITICNYSKYQDVPDETGTATDTEPGTAAVQQRYSSGTQKKKAKNSKKVRSKSIYTEKFDEFYDLYPKKDAIDAARRRFLALCETGPKKGDGPVDPDEMIDGLRAHLPAMLRKIEVDGNKDYIPAAGPWLNSGKWKDEVATLADRPFDPQDYFSETEELGK